MERLGYGIGYSEGNLLEVKVPFFFLETRQPGGEDFFTICIVSQKMGYIYQKPGKMPRLEGDRCRLNPFHEKVRVGIPLRHSISGKA